MARFQRDREDKNLGQVDINHIITNIHQYSGSGIQKLVQNLKRRNAHDNQNTQDEEEDVDDLWPSTEPAARAATTKNSDAKNKQGRPATREAEDDPATAKDKLDYQYDKDSRWKYRWGQQKPRLARLQEGGVGHSLGMKYASLAHTNKRLSFAAEVPRSKRTKVLSSHLFEKRPPVGHYFRTNPQNSQFGQAAARPKSQG